MKLSHEKTTYCKITALERMRWLDEREKSQNSKTNFQENIINENVFYQFLFYSELYILSGLLKLQKVRNFNFF